MASPPEPDERARLELRIADDPDDVDTWQVYADLLQRAGDPRGELISLQIATAAELRADPKKRGPAQRAMLKLFARHAETWLGPLRRYMPDPKRPFDPPLSWRHGFLHRAVLEPSHLGDGTDPAAVLRDILGHPSGRLLSELSVRVGDHFDPQAVLAVLRERPPIALRDLELLARASLGDLVPTLRALPPLRHLSLTVRSFELEDLDDELAELERARLQVLGFSPECLEAIARAPWPALSRLELRIGTRGSLTADPSGLQRPTAAFEDLRPLFQRTDLPALTHLRVRACSFAGGILRAVVAGPLGQQLEVLDLCHGTVTPQDIAAVAPHAALPALRELWLPARAAWNDGLARIGHLAKHVISDAKAPADTLADVLGD